MTPGRFGESRKCRDVRARIVIDHLDTVAPGVRNERRRGSSIEGAVIEQSCRRRSGFSSCREFNDMISAHLSLATDRVAHIAVIS